MKGLLKRLQSRKGSVLFLVVVVMSLLIIAASATYYVVSNQRNAVTVRYSNEQSYQTAVSMCNSVSGYIQGYLNMMATDGEKVNTYNNIVEKLLAGQTITTDDLDLSAMGMGENTSITIKPSGSSASGEKTTNYFDITVQSTVNGETTTLTQVIAIETGPTEYFTRFLTSTGNHPNDVVFCASEIYSSAYFENEFTVFSGATLNDSIYSTGTLVDRGLIYPTSGSAKAATMEVVIAENFYAESTSGSTINAARIYVGGNFETSKAFGANEVFIGGDMDNRIALNSNTTYFINGDLHANSNIGSGTFYINGDLHLGEYGDWWGSATYYVAGDVYIYDGKKASAEGTKGYANAIHYVNDLHNNNPSLTGGTYTYQDEEGNDVTITTGGIDSILHKEEETTVKETISAALKDKGFEDWTGVQNYIVSSTSKNEYGIWDVESYFNNTLNKDGSLEEIKLDDITNSHVDLISGGLDTNTGKYGGSWVVTLDDNCVLRPADDWSNANCNNILIDASTKDIYIYLKPKDGDNTFSFSVLPGDDGHNVNVYVRGSHSVIFIVPENVNFTFDGHTTVCHIDLYRQAYYNKYGDILTDNDILYKFETGYSGVAIKDGNNTAFFRDLYSNITDLFKTTDEGVLFDRTKFLPGSKVHNNIFLVTKGKSNILDFGRESSFCGYIYAPYGQLKCDEAHSSFSFLGGLIIGSYTYDNKTAKLAFTTPYDYDGIYGGKKTNIVKSLMGQANALAGEDGSGNANDKSIQGFAVVGYR